ncbi:uracil-DNA glycosylase family protein [Oscillospiraceae bacterium PP1C4]
MNIKNELLNTVAMPNSGITLYDLEIDAESIRAIMINEVVPANPQQDFYGGKDADYLKTTIPLFQKAGLPVVLMDEILSMGIYITNAVKIPKTEYHVKESSIEDSLPFLEKELALFPNLKVIMLMGDVAKKAFNKITRKTAKRNVVPAIPTYKLRNSEIYYGDIRVMPSYIMTGGNILIEKSKFEMAAEDISIMVNLIK